MPALSDGQVEVLRSWVGEAEELVELQERYDRLGNLDAVVLETLKAQLAVMVSDSPATMTVEGMTINRADNIRALQAQLDEFRAMGGTGLETEAVPGSIQISRLHRAQYR